MPMSECALSSICFVSRFVTYNIFSATENRPRAAPPSTVRLKVRHDLEQYALPNFFTEAKGPDGKASEAKRQITQDLAVGAHGMLMM
jgi:hypothetical protein